MYATTHSIGGFAENLVSDYLVRHGLAPHAANYQCKHGEIDLIMRDGDAYVFVEVRHRKSRDYGDGVATVTKSKQRKIIKTAMHYLLENDLYDKVPCRFDVVATSMEGECALKWVKDAFWTKW